MAEMFRYCNLPVPVYRMTMPGGMTLFVIERPTKFVRAEVCLDVGSLDDGDHSGLSHFLEHLVFEGPAREGVHPKLRDLALNGVGGGAATSPDHTRYWVNGLDEELRPLILALLSIVFSAKFMVGGLEGEKGPVVAEIHKYAVRDSYGDWRTRQLYPAIAAWYQGNAGTADTVRGMGLENVVSQYRRHYRPENAALIVSSRFRPEIVAAVVAAGLLRSGSFESGMRTIRPPLSPTTFVGEHRSPYMTDFLQWVFPGSDDFFSVIRLGLALDMLCDWPFGTIHASIRVRHSLTYSVESGTMAAPFPVSEITIWVDRSKFEAVETLFAEEVGRMAENGPSEESFRATMGQRRRYFLGLDEDPAALFSVLRKEWLRGKIEDVDWRKAVLEVTREEIAQIAARLLNMKFCSRIRHLCE